MQRWPLPPLLSTPRPWTPASRSPLRRSQKLPHPSKRAVRSAPPLQHPARCHSRRPTRCRCRLHRKLPSNFRVTSERLPSILPARGASHPHIMCLVHRVGAPRCTCPYVVPTSFQQLPWHWLLPCAACRLPPADAFHRLATRRRGTSFNPLRMLAAVACWPLSGRRMGWLPNMGVLLPRSGQRLRSQGYIAGSGLW